MDEERDAFLEYLHNIDTDINDDFDLLEYLSAHPEETGELQPAARHLSD